MQSMPTTSDGSEIIRFYHKQVVGRATFKDCIPALVTTDVIQQHILSFVKIHRYLSIYSSMYGRFSDERNFERLLEIMS